MHSSAHAVAQCADCIMTQALGMLWYNPHMVLHVRLKSRAAGPALQLETSPGCAPQSPATCWTRLQADLLRAFPSGWSASVQEAPAPGRHLEKDVQMPMADLAISCLLQTSSRQGHTGKQQPEHVRVGASQISAQLCSYCVPYNIQQ